jgi:putative ABC transport system permease protein
VPFANLSFEQKYQLLRDELLTHASIVDLSSAYTVPGINSRMNMSVNKEGEATENSINMQVLPIDYGFVRALDLKIIAGRDFSKRHSLDQSESVLLNESGVIALGMEKPVGTKLIIPGNGKSREVIGVVEDFHIQSLHHRINPLLLYINPKMAVTVVLKLLPGNNHDTIEFVKQTWNNILPETEFNYKYLKDSYENLYYAEEKTSKLLSIFTVLAIYISCLGLFGLAALIARQKTKEIGIRKVLGATISSIVILFSKEFSIWVIIANILAWPFAWMVIDKWLQNFAYRIEISLWVFVVSGLIVLLIALITISSRAIMAAITNPVEALRYE